MAFVAVFGCAGASILVALGVWQVQRLAWKEALLADIETMIAAEPGPMPARPDPGVDRFRPVVARGRILEGELRARAIQPGMGPGARIVAPFVTANGRRILVDRGFVPDSGLGPDATAARDGEGGGGEIEIAGNLDWPRETDVFTPKPDRETETWYARDVAAMAEALDSEPVLLVARSRTGPSVTPVPVSTAGIPNSHFGYAVTWFSLAAAWVAMSVLYLVRGPASASAPRGGRAGRAGQAGRAGRG